MIKIKQKYANNYIKCKVNKCNNRARIKGYCVNCYTLIKKYETKKIEVNVLHDLTNKDYEIHYRKQLIGLASDKNELNQLIELNNYEIKSIKDVK